MSSYRALEVYQPQLFLFLIQVFNVPKSIVNYVTIFACAQCIAKSYIFKRKLTKRVDFYMATDKKLRSLSYSQILFENKTKSASK